MAGGSTGRTGAASDPGLRLLVGGRALGLITSGDASGYNLSAIVFELTGAASAAWVYAGLPRSDAR